MDASIAVKSVSWYDHPDALLGAACVSFRRSCGGFVETIPIRIVEIVCFAIIKHVRRRYTGQLRTTVV
jgi:hypothetical protein